MTRSKCTLLATAFALFSFVGLAMAESIDVQVADGNDDAEEHLDDNRMDLTSSDLELGEEGAGDFQEVGMRFLNVGIPAGSTIDLAYIQFTSDDDDTDDIDTSLRIYGELSPDPAAYADVAGNITDRTKTSSFMDWNNVPPWLISGETGPDQQTPDLSAVLQEVIGQPGWAAGNAMALIVVPNPGGERTAESFNGDTALAPVLHVEYTIVPEPSTLALASFSLLVMATFNRRRRRIAS